jgi:hypothetical protein
VTNSTNYTELTARDVYNRIVNADPRGRVSLVQAQYMVVNGRVMFQVVEPRRLEMKHTASFGQTVLDIVEALSDES